MPLTDCNAMSQGYIGAQLTRTLINQFRSQDIMRAVVDVPTHVLVDASDEAFKDFEKPIGAFMTEKDAQAFAKATGCQVKEDSGRGWRRVVPSPAPQDILELGVISSLVDNGCIVVAAGGGGIPVILEDDRYKAVDAIIDKDLVTTEEINRIAAETADTTRKSAETLTVLAEQSRRLAEMVEQFKKG